jgi:DNA polymerase III epsilon subunit-like protein
VISQLPIIVIDYETGGNAPESDKCELLQIAAQVIEPINFNIKKNACFDIYIKPRTWDNVRQDALNKNKITKELIDKKGVDLKIGWKAYVDFILRYNREKNVYTAPIPAGMNIIGYDLPITERLCKELGPYDDQDGRQKLFSNRNRIELIDIAYLFFSKLKDVDNLKLDTIREYLGISKDGAHNAVKDVADTAAIISRFLKFCQNVGLSTKFAGTMRGI